MFNGLAFLDAPSPNFDERALPVTMIVLHYTGMESAAAALDRLRDPAAKVSAHYLVDEDGTIRRLVPEEKRAWHAGRSHWRGITDVNSASIGIEIVNPGHDWGYPDFPLRQIAAVIALCRGIMLRRNVPAHRVLAHSDVAPGRKKDPGELFNWHALARLRLALPRPTKNLMDPGWPDAGFIMALERFGYDVSDEQAAVIAFQRRFRPEMIDGEIDMECRCLLLALLLPKPQGDE
jgi:N-acetylmuramoyl-L-alanine amidase